jgi:hypothetical protein
MIRESVLKDFPNWDNEKQLAEYQGYKRLVGYSPFSDVDYSLMEMVMNNNNAEVSVECDNGICEIVDDNLFEDVLLLEKEGTNQSIMRSIFLDIIKNSKVQQGIKKTDNKRQLIKLYNIIFKSIDDEELKHNLLTIIKKIGTKGNLKKWEMLVANRLKPFLIQLKNRELITVDPDPAGVDPIKFNYDNITKNMVIKSKKLAALLLLDLTKYMSQTDKGNVFDSFKALLNNIESTDEGFEEDEDLLTDEEDNESNKQLELVKVANNELFGVLKDINTIGLEELKADHDNDSEKEALNNEKMNLTATQFMDQVVYKNDPERKPFIFNKAQIDESFRVSYQNNVLVALKEEAGIVELLLNLMKSDESPADKAKALTVKQLKSLFGMLDVSFKGDDSKKQLDDKFLKLDMDTLTNKLEQSRVEQTKHLETIESNIGIADDLPAKEASDFLLIEKYKRIIKIIGFDKFSDPDTQLKDFLVALQHNNQFFQDLKFPAPGNIKNLLQKFYLLMKGLPSPFEDLSKALLKYAKDGEGRGEKFIEFAFQYAVSGGQSSYDIKIGPLAYEIKTYTMNTSNKTMKDPIRLGQEGNVFKSEKFARLFIFLTDAASIFNNDESNYKLLKTLFSSSMTPENYENISALLSKPIGKSHYTLMDQLRKGEFSSEHMGMFNTITRLLKSSLHAVKQNDFYFMKIFLKDKNLDLAIEPLKDTLDKLDTVNRKEGVTLSFTARTLVSKKVQKDVSTTILRILGNIEIINNENTNYLKQIIDEAMELINVEFDKHPMIVLNDFKNADHTEVCPGVFTEFKFAQITQNKFKIVPSGYQVKV